MEPLPHIRSQARSYRGCLFFIPRQVLSQCCLNISIALSCTAPHSLHYAEANNLSRVVTGEMRVVVDDVLMRLSQHHLQYLGSTCSWPPCLHACLLAPPACLPACLPAFLASYLPAWLPACLPAYPSRYPCGLHISRPLRASHKGTDAHPGWYSLSTTHTSHWRHHDTLAVS